MYNKIFRASLVVFALLSNACSSENDSEHILATRSFEEAVVYLRHPDIEMVALALWRMRAIDDPRVSDLYISIWEKDNKYENYYGDGIEDSTLIRLLVSGGLTQFGYYFSKETEDYILTKTSDSSVQIRAKAAETLGLVGTVRSVERLYDLIVNDIDRVGSRAVGSLLLIARRQIRVVSPSAVILARKKLKMLINYAAKENYRMLEYLTKLGIDTEVFHDAYEMHDLEYLSLGVYPQTFRLMKPYVDANDAYAQYIVGLKYLNGDEVDQDVIKGISYLERSAENGFYYAKLEVEKLANK